MPIIVVRLYAALPEVTFDGAWYYTNLMTRHIRQMPFYFEHYMRIIVRRNLEGNCLCSSGEA